MNDPIFNRADFELNTEKAGGVAGNVGRDLTINNYSTEINNSAPTENAALTLEINPSDYTPAELAELIETIMKSVSIIGDGTLKLAYYKKGSIKLFLSGSPEDIAEIQRLINLKELTEIEGHNITEIQENTPEEDAKISLIQGIKTGEFNQSDFNLRGADLSGANLGGVDLSWTNLSGTNLRGVDLNGANLNGANLRGASLREAILSGANLREADLSRVNLIEAI
ncbi:MAG: pentapeptide repeat-containing protein, partial [Planktothrix sp.]